MCRVIGSAAPWFMILESQKIKNFQMCVNDLELRVYSAHDLSINESFAWISVFTEMTAEKLRVYLVEALIKDNGVA